MVEWKVLSKKIVLDDPPWLTVEKWDVDCGNGKRIPDYNFVRRGNFTAIVAETDDKILFVKQYRVVAKAHILNLPMGFIDKGETEEECARREFLEETGYQAKEMENVGTAYVAASFLSSKMTVFYTKDIQLQGEPTDSGETCELIHIPKSEIQSLISENKLIDMTSLSALMMAWHKLDLK
ncbi:MAG: NUDIX hydrolase [Nanoarchaeota archaeon]|nr:NUDIX hydrolase [Nanoarchaeota archaeon]